MIDAPKMTIREINREIKKLIIDEDHYIRMIMQIWNNTQPKPVDLTLERVSGGIKEEKFLTYVIKCEEPEYLELIDNYEKSVKLRKELTRYVEKRFELINLIDNPKHKRIIELREHTPKTWEEIASDNEIDMSEVQCWRIYKKYLENL